MSTDERPEAGPASTGRRMRWVWRGLRISIALAIALLVGLGAVYTRLLFGPIESDTIARAAERIASQALGAGRSASIGYAALEYSGEEGLAIRLEDIHVGEVRDGIVIAVPAALIRLRVLPLLFGQIKPSGFSLNNPSAFIDLELADAGRLGGTLEAAAEPEPAAPLANAAAPRGVTPDVVARIEDFARLLANSARHIRQEGLVEVRARSGTVDITLPRRADGTRRHLQFREVELASLFGGKETDADISLSARGGIGRWSSRLRQTTDASSGQRRLFFEAKDLILPDLTGLSEPDLKIEMPLYPFLLIEMDKQDRIQVARLSMKLGAGMFRFGKQPEDEIQLDEGEVDIAWDKDARRFLVNHLSFDVGQTHLSFLGSVTPPPKQTAPWGFRLDLEHGSLAPRDVAAPKPLPVEGVHIQGTFEQPRRLLTIEEAQMQVAGAAVAASGSVDFAVTPPRGAFSLASTAIEAEPLKQAWPHWVAAGGRKWFIENVVSGRILPATARLNIPLGVDPPLWPKDSVLLDGQFEGGVAHPLGDLPLVVDAAGRFHLENRVFDVVTTKANVATRTARQPRLPSLTLNVPDALAKPARGRIDLRLEGEALALAEIINAEPLSVLDNATVRQDGIQGTTDLTGRIEMTFDPDPAVQNLAFNFNATLDRFGSSAPIFGRKFSDGQLKVAVDKQGTRITGKAKIDGVATDVNMFEPSDKKVQERRDFSLIIDDAARQRLGIELNGMIAGPMKVDLAQGTAGPESKKVTADLTTARISLVQFGWTKGAGVPAKATFDLIPDPGKGMRLENFSVESEGLQIKGQVSIDASNQFIGADIPRFALRKGDDAKLKVVRSPDGVLNVQFDAASFDIRSLIQAIRQASSTARDKPGSPKAKSSDLNVKVRAARLVGFNDVAFSDVAIDAQLRSQTMTQLVFSSRASGGRAVDISIKPDSSGGRVLYISTDDGGSLLSFFDIYDRITGGTVTLKGQLGAPGQAVGAMTMIGFRVLQKGRGGDAAVKVSPDGTRELSVRDADISETATFDRFGLSFSMRGGVIDISDLIAKGQSTGATASGTVNLTNQRLDVQGTFIPLYGLNNTISRIPVFGEIFGGGQNGGLIGVTFRVLGPIDNPVIQFNPLSVVAPGIFRKIFEFRGDAPPAPQPGGAQ